MKRFLPELRPLAPSGLPLTDPSAAWGLVLKHLPHTPAWASLPRRSFLERPENQFSEGFPGVVFESERIYISETWDQDPALDRLYIAYLENDVDYGSISRHYAAALALLLEGNAPLPESAVCLKGHVVGPLSWGLRVSDHEGSPVLYNEVMLDAAAKHLRLKVAWQESALRALNATTLLLLEEPLLTPAGLESLPFEKGRALALVEDVVGGATGYRGFHCGYPFDESILSTSANVLHIDVADVTEGDRSGLAGLGEYITRNGLIVWGIVPADERVGSRRAAELADALQSWLEGVAVGDVELGDVAAASMVSSAAGLDALEAEAVEDALHLIAEVSRIMRDRYSFA